MNRTHLERAIGQRATTLGYGFRCADIAYLPHELPPFPAAWLEPPLLHAIEGRTRGRITYDLTLHLLRDGARLGDRERLAVWASLEEDMLAVFTSLSAEQTVVGVEALTIRPRTYALTTRGEISQSAQARVVTWFENPKKSDL